MGKEPIQDVEHQNHRKRRDKTPRGKDLLSLGDIVTLITVAVICLCLGFGVKWFKDIRSNDAGPLIRDEVTIDVAVLKAQIKHINELATLKENYQKVIEYKVDKFLLDRQAIWQYQGVIRAGINVDQIDIVMSGYDNDGNPQLVIALPEVKIIDNSDYNVETIYEENMPDDVGDIRNEKIKEAEAEKQKELESNGFLEQAKENAKKFISEIVYSTYGDNVKISFTRADN